MANVRHQLTDVVAAAVTTSVRVWYAPVDENLLDVTRGDHVGDGGAVLGEELQCPNLNTLVHGVGKAKSPRKILTDAAAIVVTIR